MKLNIDGIIMEGTADEVLFVLKDLFKSKMLVEKKITQDIIFNV